MCSTPYISGYNTVLIATASIHKSLIILHFFISTHYQVKADVMLHLLCLFGFLWTLLAVPIESKFRLSIIDHNDFHARCVRFGSVEKCSPPLSYHTILLYGVKWFCSNFEKRSTYAYGMIPFCLIKIMSKFLLNVNALVRSQRFG